jgi:3'-phosphoadenosine 5'-phosphosulfate (PAPS) 3'-phosphatase
MKTEDGKVEDSHGHSDNSNVHATPTVNLLKLATHCIYATLLAAKPIQEYRSDHDENTNSTSTSNSNSNRARTKSDGTLVTDADGAAQRIIYNEIRSLDSNVRIVGEEDDLEMEVSKRRKRTKQRHSLNRSGEDYGGDNDDVHDHRTTRKSQNEELFRQVEQDMENHCFHGQVSTSASTSATASASTGTSSAVLPTTEISALGSDDDSSILPVPPVLYTDSSNIQTEQTEDTLTRTDTDTMEMQIDVDNMESATITQSNRVSVFVDPLDGTSSYAKGHYEAVTILVAIIVDNQPVFGVIVKPFGVGTNLHRFGNTECSVLYGGTLVGGAFVLGGEELERSRSWRGTTKNWVGMEEGSGSTSGGSNCLRPVGEPDCKRQKQRIQEENGMHGHGGSGGGGGPSPTSVCNSMVNDNDGASIVKDGVSSLPPLPTLSKRRAIISKSRRGGVVQKCIESLSSRNLIHHQPLFITGAGYKTMKLVLGEDDETLWFFPKPGTSLWDVAAADALLRVMGGRISDKYGRDLNYGKGRLEADNLDGIIACSDSRLHTLCLELYKKEQWED